VAKYNKHYYPKEHSGICVVKRKGESVEDLIKRFRKKYSKSGIVKEFRDRMYFEKPSDRRRRKIRQSIRLIEREKEQVQKMKKHFQKLRARKARKKKKKRQKERKEQND